MENRNVACKVKILNLVVSQKYEYNTLLPNIQIKMQFLLFLNEETMYNAYMFRNSAVNMACLYVIFVDEITSPPPHFNHFSYSLQHPRL